MGDIRHGDESPRTAVHHPSALGEQVPARDLFVRRTATVVAITTIAGLLIALFVLGIDVLLAAFGGVLIAVLLNAFSSFVERHTPLTYGWALTAVVLIILILFGIGGWLLAPKIAEQANQLSQQLPTVVEKIKNFLQQYGWGQWILNQAQNGWPLSGAAGDSGGGFSAFSRWSSYFLVAVFVGLFAAADPKLYQDGIVHLFPLRHRSRIRELLGELGYTLRWWLIGQAIAMLLIGVSTMVVLWVFGIRLAIVLGIIVGLLNFIPYLGPIIAAIPIALIAATAGATQLLYVMLAYTAVQLLEGYVATPLIQHRTVYLPPAFTVTSLFLLGTVLGTLGIVVATPLAAIVLVLTRFYRSDILGDREAEEGGSNTEHTGGGG